jgi:hypothetical protein
MKTKLQFECVMKSFMPFYLLIVFIALSPANCLALSYPNSPCDVGGGYFFYLPSYSEEGWHIYHDDETQKIVCYHTDDEDGFISGSHPVYDFDETWIYIADTIHEPKYAEPVSHEKNSTEEVPERKLPNQRKNRDVYFLFNKETREMAGPLTAEEFMEHPAVLGKIFFDWKRGDYKNSKGVGRLILLGFAFFVVLPMLLLVVLFYLLSKWAFRWAYGKQETKQVADFDNEKPSLNADKYSETNAP